MPPVHSTQRIPFSKYETRELENFRILHWVLLEVGSACVRKVFDTEIQPDQLKKILVANRVKICSVTTKEQISVLYPARGEPTVTSQLFDITLLILLLKHLVDGLFISDIQPHESDVSIGADLSRLKYYRNKFSHLPSCKINDKEFEELYKDIIQVIGRLGCPEWVEHCEKDRKHILETCKKEEKSLLLQLFIILHSKGHNVLNKVSETFWSYSTTELLCLILSLLDFHFWIYPTIKTIWDEFQDSYYMNSDSKFFERIECHLQSDTQGPQYGECFPKLSSATGTMPIERSHTIEINGKNYQDVIETDENITETEEAKNIIKIKCRCHLEKAGLCFLILFSQLNTRRYRHDHNTTNENSDDIYQYHTLGNNEIMKYIAQDEEKMYTEKMYTEKMQIELETHMGSNIFFPPQSVDLIPAAYSYTCTSLSYNTSTGYDLCNTVCDNRNLLN